MPSYTKRLRSLLSPAEARVFGRLTTPQKVQDYLDTFPINFDTRGDVLSPRRVLKEHKMQCLEGALFAAASLAYHGRVPLLLDFQTTPEDEDHVVAIFKEKGFWGALSKTNHGILRWRDPIYKSLRELSMSYFHEYYMHDGRKTMRAYSGPFDLRRYKPEEWVVASKNLERVAEELDSVRHFPAVPTFMMRSLRRASPIERKLLDVVEWKRPKKK